MADVNYYTRKTWALAKYIYYHFFFFSKNKKKIIK